MFVAMNRFRVAKGSEAAFENVWMSREAIWKKSRALSSFIFSKAPRLRITHFMLLTLFGKTVLCLKLGPNRKRSVQRIVGQGTTSRCIWIIRSLRGSRFARR